MSDRRPLLEGQEDGRYEQMAGDIGEIGRRTLEIRRYKKNLFRSNCSDYSI